MRQWNAKGIYNKSLPIIDQLLQIRNIDNIDTFLKIAPLKEEIQKLSLDTSVAVSLIKEAISKNIPIIIHGDYDADGILATTIMYKALKHGLGYENTYWFIPNRFVHGYGLSLTSANEMRAMVEKPFLLITVDCGITSVNEVAYLKDKGCTVIVTDHHQKPEVIPNVDALLWDDKLVGSSIAFVLASHLGDTSSSSIAYAAIATITDLQRLRGFNRVLVKEGLEIINSQKCPVGLRALITVAGKSNIKVSTYEIGWLVGPRINATGRIDTASSALNLFLTEDETEALSFAQNLNDLNANRQDLTEEMFNIASISEINPSQKIIVSYSKDYHEGIIGLVAAKLAQKFYRPAIVISVSDNIAKGSARSIPGVNIIEFLRNLDFTFSGLGGHPMAAGFSITIEQLPEFEERVLSKAFEMITDAQLVPTLYADLEIPVDIVDIALVADISKLEPFGVENEEPAFISKDLIIGKINFIGKESKHVSFDLISKSGAIRRGVFFNGADEVKAFSIGDEIDIVYKIQSKLYQGKEYIDLIIRDIRPTTVVL